MTTVLRRHPSKALTAQFVKNIKVPGKYFDGHGLYLRVEKNGTRFWIQRIKIRGKRTEMGLGSAQLVGLAEVREAAIKNYIIARSGGDPLNQHKEEKGYIDI